MRVASPTLVSLRHLSKSYGGVAALTDVSFDIAAGEVHALCGENGAGKSTLIKIISGAVVPDAGEIVIDGKPLSLGDVRGSEDAGVAVIHQESVAFAHLGAADNIFLGREPRRLGGLLLDRGEMRRRTQMLLDNLGEAFDPSQPLEELTVAQRQMVGIARALSKNCRLLIMDEPTASLSERETRTLFEIMRRLRADGVAILYVSHRMEEIFALADRATVFRDGRFVATKAIAELTQGELIKLMVGREVSLLSERTAISDSGTGFQPVREAAISQSIVPKQIDVAEHGLETRATVAAGDVHAAAGDSRLPKRGVERVGVKMPMLSVEGLTRAGVFRDITFVVRPGEIVGLAGLVGAGRSEVARAIFGLDPIDAGTIWVHGRELKRHTVKDAIAAGVSLVPEDRQHEGLVLPMSVGTNLSLAVLRSLTKGGLIDSAAERSAIEKFFASLSIKAASPALAVSSLSGGNQQKVLLAKWLAGGPRVLILDEPTRGIDVGAKAEVHRLIRKLASEGLATLLISSELPEVLSLSDRVLVMRQAAIAGELAGDEATQERVLELALPKN